MLILVMMSFFTELKERNVYRAALAYIVVAWVLTQVAAIIFPTFGAPDWVMKAFIFLLIIGFPIALVLAWAQGMKKSVPLEDPEKTASVKPDERSVNSPRTTIHPRSIAVLPFQDLSQNKDQEYFSDGIAEEVLDALAKVDDLKVIGRTSSFSFKNKQATIREIGSTLSVAHVLEGSVRKMGDQLRITAQLIVVADETHAWSQTFNRKLTDIFDIQEEIALAILKELKGHILGSERDAISERKTDNIKAYELYMQGLHLWKIRGPAIIQALQYFEQAVDIDPDYSLAYAGLANCYNIMVVYGLGAPKEFMPKADLNVVKALSLDPNLAEAHSAKGMISFMYEWDWKKAKFHFEKALDIDRSTRSALIQYSFYLSWIEGQFDKSIRLTEEGINLDPHYDPLTLYYHSQNLFMKGDYEEVCHWAQRLIDFDPGNPNGHRSLVHGLWGLEKYKESIKAADMGVRLTSRHPYALAELCYSHALSGNHKMAQDLLDELLQPSKTYHNYLFYTAIAHLGLDQFDESIEALEQAYENREGFLLLIKYEPKIFTPLRNDLRFEALIHKIGYPDSSG